MNVWRLRTMARVFVILLALVSVLGAGVVEAQGTRGATINASKKRPLRDALRELAAKADINFSFHTSVDAYYTDVSIRIDIPAEEMLRQLLDGTDLDFYQLESGTYALIQRDVKTRPIFGIFEGRVLDRETKEPLPNAAVVLTFPDDVQPGWSFSGDPVNRGTPAFLNRHGTVTNNAGEFSFPQLVPGRYRVLVAFIGFISAVDTIEVVGYRTSRTDIILEPHVIALAPLVVDGNQPSSRIFGTDLLLGVQELQQKYALGAPDVILGLNQLMGVRVSDAMADVHVQAGEAGEHQFRLDGVPIFEPIHLTGLLGAFSPFAIQKITVHRAGFGAPYGSHLSGVLLAEHAVSGPENRNFDFQVDPLSINGRVHMSFGQPAGIFGQFMAAARTSVWNLYQPGVYAPLKDLLREWNTPDTFLPYYTLHALEEFDPQAADVYGLELDTIKVSLGSDPKLGYTDLHSAFRIQFDPGRKLYGSFYRGSNQLNGNQVSITLGDKVSPSMELAGENQLSSGTQSSNGISTNKDTYRWINTEGQVQYSTILNNRVGVTTRLRGSRYSLYHTYNTLETGAFIGIPREDGTIFPLRKIDDIRPADNGNTISEAALESTLDYAPNTRHLVELGLETVYAQSRFTIEDVFYLYQSIRHESKDWRIATFLEDKISYGNGFELTLGTRATILSQYARVYLEPRFSIRQEVPAGVGGRWSWRFSTGLYRQYTNQFNMSSVSPSALLSSIRFWLPLDSTVTPPKAFHFAAGFEYEPTPSWSFQINSYYKNQSHILTIDYPSLLERLGTEVNSDFSSDSVYTGQSSFLRNGKGFAYGSAVSAEHVTNKFRLLIRYEFNMARRSRTLLPELAEESTSGIGSFDNSALLDTTSLYESVPWNEPHRLDLAFDWKPTRRFTTTVRWRGVWSRKWGFRQAYYDFLANYPIPTHRIGDTSFRRPEEHDLSPLYQLDVGLAYTHVFDIAAIQIRADVLNALNRANVADYSARIAKDENGETIMDENGQTILEKVPRTLLPRMPSIALRVMW